MSLEQQVSSLVTAANKLTGTVNAKFGEIDKKVDASIKEVNAAIPTAIQNALTPAFFVDPENGNNDNDGKSKEKAFQTIYKAISSISPGSDGNIYLMRGNHNIDIQCNVFNKKVQFSYHVDASTADTKVIFNCGSALNVEYNGFVLLGGTVLHFNVDESISLRKGSIYINSCSCTIENGVTTPVVSRYHLSFSTVYRTTISSDQALNFITPASGGSYIANGESVTLSNVTYTVDQLVA